MNRILDSEKITDNEKKLFDKVDQFLPNAVVTNTDEIEKKFYSAGFYSFKFSHLYMPMKYVSALLGFSLIYIFFNDVYSITTLIIFMFILLVLCVVVPDLILDYRVNSIKNKISNQLPFLLDLLAMCVQTGMTIESSLEYLSSEMKGFDKDLAHMIKRLNSRARVIGLIVALEELYTRFPTNEMRSFVMTLRQSLHYGSSIYDVLNTLASDIRSVRLLLLEEKVGKLAAKMSVPLILFIMIPVVILIAAPGIMRMMSGVY
nr:type II secretion system F family protein [Aliivibrio fischeri]